MAAYFKDLSKEKAAIEEMLSKAEGITHVGSFEFELPSGVAIWSDEMYSILDLLPNEVVAHTDVFTNMVLPAYVEEYKKWILKESSIEVESKPILSKRNFKISS